MELEIFKGFGIRTGNEIHASRIQVEELYDIPSTTLLDNIKRLKEDGLINPTEIRVVAKDAKQRLQEVYDIDEVIAIGLRLRSDKAIYLQKYAVSLIKNDLKKLENDKKMLELELSYAWNKSDQNSLYR
ncbi:hypothetical protein SAMN03097699_0776 [Flavobacteriaceae bacterium MAR_2010_188]|nr:hypothetical protein SAMN03097699_0776 [Flavobacteriaceae bacterium MAR_2010_188]